MSPAAPRRTALALLVLALTGCVGSPDAQEALAEEIAINRAVWEAQRPRHYRFVLARQCFCPPEALGPVAVEVDGTTVVSRAYVDGGGAVDPVLAESFPAVSGLFDILADAVASGADRVDVTWDPGNGVPRSIFIDYQTNLADEEQGYTVEAGPDEIPDPEDGG